MSELVAVSKYKKPGKVKRFLANPYNSELVAFIGIPISAVAYFSAMNHSVWFGLTALFVTLGATVVGATYTDWHKQEPEVIRQEMLLANQRIADAKAILNQSIQTLSDQAKTDDTLADILAMSQKRLAQLETLERNNLAVIAKIEGLGAREQGVQALLETDKLVDCAS